MIRYFNIRHAILAILILALSSCATGQEDRSRLDMPPATQSSKGHVAFFFIAGMEYRNTREAYGEFIYGYESAKKALLSEGYSYSYHSDLPLNIDNGGLKLSLSKKNLTEGAGLVLLKSKNRFRVVYGVFTGADIVKMSREYFQRRP